IRERRGSETGRASAWTAAAALPPLGETALNICCCTGHWHQVHKSVCVCVLLHRSLALCACVSVCLCVCVCVCVCVCCTGHWHQVHKCVCVCVRVCVLLHRSLAHHPKGGVSGGLGGVCATLGMSMECSV